VASGLPYNRNYSVTRLLGLGTAKMRAQNPTVQKTTGIDHLQPDGSTKRVKERIYLATVAELTKQQARAKAREEMSVINNHARVIHAQINFAKFLDEYEENFILKLDNLSVSTQAKYRTRSRITFGRVSAL
jgi:hypothetical protein